MTALLSTSKPDSSSNADLFAEYAATRHPALLEMLVEANLPLVKFVANRMAKNLPRTIEFDDLLSWGSMGLLDAIEKFDPSKGFKFSSYAVMRIRGDIIDRMRRAEHAPRTVIAAVMDVRRAGESLTTELGRAPTNAELAERSKKTEAEVREALFDDRIIHSTIGSQSITEMDDPNSPWSAMSCFRTEAVQDIAGVEAELRRRLSRALAALAPREVELVLMHYRDNLTLKQISEVFEISTSGATQVYSRLLETLRGELSAWGPVISAA